MSALFDADETVVLRFLVRAIAVVPHGWEGNVRACLASAVALWPAATLDLFSAEDRAAVAEAAAYLRHTDAHTDTRRLQRLLELSRQGMPLRLTTCGFWATAVRCAFSLGFDLLCPLSARLEAGNDRFTEAIWTPDFLAMGSFAAIGALGGDIGFIVAVILAVHYHAFVCFTWAMDSPDLLPRAYLLPYAQADTNGCYACTRACIWRCVHEPLHYVIVAPLTGVRAIAALVARPLSLLASAEILKHAFDLLCPMASIEAGPLHSPAWWMPNLVALAATLPAIVVGGQIGMVLGVTLLGSYVFVMNTMYHMETILSGSDAASLRVHCEPIARSPPSDCHRVIRDGVWLCVHAPLHYIMLAPGAILYVAFKLMAVIGRHAQLLNAAASLRYAVDLLCPLTVNDDADGHRSMPLPACTLLAALAAILMVVLNGVKDQLQLLIVLFLIYALTVNSIWLLVGAPEGLRILPRLRLCPMVESPPGACFNFARQVLFWSLHLPLQYAVLIPFVLLRAAYIWLLRPFARWIASVCSARVIMEVQ